MADYFNKEPELVGLIRCIREHIQTRPRSVGARLRANMG